MIGSLRYSCPNDSAIRASMNDYFEQTKNTKNKNQSIIRRQNCRWIAANPFDSHRFVTFAQ